MDKKLPLIIVVVGPKAGKATLLTKIAEMLQKEPDLTLRSTKLVEMCY